MAKGKRVAVIGGGYAGMAAAMVLARKDAHVTVFEAGPVLGGRARRINWQGQMLDNGQHILIGAYRVLSGLVNIVHDGDPPWLEIPMHWEMQGRMRMTLPAGRGRLPLLVGLMRAQGWSKGDKLAFLRRLVRLRVSAPPPADMTVATWLRDERPTLIDTFWTPLTLAALNTPPEVASAQVLVQVLRDSLLADAEACQLLLPTVDLSRLFPEPAAEWLQDQGHDVRLRFTARLVPYPDGVGIEGERFDAAICAVAPHRLTTVLSDPMFAAVRETAARLRYQPIRTVYLQYDRSLETPAPMLGLMDGPGQWLFDRDRLLGETGRMAVVISAEGPYDNWSGEELARRVQIQLRGHFPHWPDPVWTKTIEEARATFSCEAGLVRPRPETASPYVWLAGDYVAGDYPATLEGAVRSGVAAAKLAMESL